MYDWAIATGQKNRRTVIRGPSAVVLNSNLRPFGARQMCIFWQLDFRLEPGVRLATNDRKDADGVQSRLTCL